MKIETAVADDIPSIVRVANALQLDPAQAPASFLVSNFGSEKYRELCNLRENGRFFIARDPAGALVGFIIAYRNEYAASNADISLERKVVDQLCSGGSFWILKQIAVDPMRQRQGIARALMKHLLASIPGQHVLSHIVSTPPNIPSEMLHKSLGFVRTKPATTRDTVNNERYGTNIWLRAKESDAR
jgi:ribosomal protein S18 acetylase RimI-like enzyme